ncbi:MAG: ABC transporter permease [Anaerolineae bacterium]|nr:ABC transporter permease [Anaerolineae bacterium]
MRFWSIFRKAMIEQWRNPLILILSLIFGPFFVYLYSLFFSGGSTVYAVLVQNVDTGAELADGTRFEAGEELVEAIAGVAYADGSPMLRVKPMDDMDSAEAKLRDREAILYVVIPADFSEAILDAREGGELSTTIEFGGDLTNPYYMVAAIITLNTVDLYIQDTGHYKPPIQYVEKPLGGSGTRSEFEVYIPGIFVFSIILMVFQASMTIAREVEAGTLRRLQITRMNAFELMGGTTLSLIITSLISVALTFLTAVLLGFESHGPLWVAILVCVIASLSIIGAGLIVAAFSKTVSQAFIISNFPLGLFMFLSGAVFPLPLDRLFTVAGHGVSLADLLPATHAVVALSKIMTLGAGFTDVLWELGWLTVLSVLFFAIGAWLFGWRQMRAG